MKIQLSIKHLENAIEIAKERIKNDSSLSNIIEFEKTNEIETHLKENDVVIRIKNIYAECNPTLIGY